MGHSLASAHTSRMAYAWTLKKEMNKKNSQTQFPWFPCLFSCLFCVECRLQLSLWIRQTLLARHGPLTLPRIITIVACLNNDNDADDILWTMDVNSWIRPNTWNRIANEYMSLTFKIISYTPLHAHTTQPECALILAIDEVSPFHRFSWRCALFAKRFRR